MAEGTHIVVSGNPFDGLTLHGLFPDAESANEWADAEVRGDDWWVAPLNAVEQPKPETPSVLGVKTDWCGNCMAQTSQERVQDGWRCYRCGMVVT